MEIWKDIQGYEGLYQVSNLGRVKSLGNGNSTNSKHNSEHLLKQQTTIEGYKRAMLCLNSKKKWYAVHRLVATAFIDNINNYPQINHKNENTSDNRVENLEWCTSQYNYHYGTRIQRVTESNSRPVIATNIKTGEVLLFSSTMDASRKLGLVQSNISRCCNGIRTYAGGFKWQFNNQ